MEPRSIPKIAAGRLVLEMAKKKARLLLRTRSQRRFPAGGRFCETPWARNGARCSTAGVLIRSLTHGPFPARHAAAGRKPGAHRAACPAARSSIHPSAPIVSHETGDQVRSGFLPTVVMGLSQLSRATPVSSGRRKFGLHLSDPDRDGPPTG